MNTKLNLPLGPLALVAAVFATTATSTLFAAEGGRHAGKEHGGPRSVRPIPAELTSRYDANGDGQLDETERATLDADMQAGKITPPGRRGAGHPRGPGGPDARGEQGGPGRRGAGGPPPGLVAKFDANGDGQLDAAEREALHNAVKSGDVEPPRGGRHGRPGRHPGGADDETTGRLAKMLEKFDANHDGVLDEAERNAMREARRASAPPVPPPAGQADPSSTGPAVIRKGRRN